MIPDPSPIPIAKVRQTLDYRHRPRLSWIGRHKKKLIFLALCLAIAIPVYRNWAPLKHRVLWLYWFNQAMAFRMPEKPVDLRIHDPQNAAQAMAANLAYQRSKQGYRGIIPVEFVPVVYRRLFEQDSRLNLTAMVGNSVAFMGRMERPDGIPRLVIVMHSDGMDSQILNRTAVLALPIPKWNDPLPPATSPQYGWGISINGPPPSIARFRSGMLDPADHTHLIFDYIIGPGMFSAAQSPSTPDNVVSSGVIDAYLKNDDALHFSIRGPYGVNTGLGQSGARAVASLSGDIRTLQSLVGSGRIPISTLPPIPAAQPSTSRK